MSTEQKQQMDTELQSVEEMLSAKHFVQMKKMEIVMIMTDLDR